MRGGQAVTREGVITDIKDARWYDSKYGRAFKYAFFIVDDSGERHKAMMIIEKRDPDDNLQWEMNNERYPNGKPTLKVGDRIRYTAKEYNFWASIGKREDVEVIGEKQDAPQQESRGDFKVGDKVRMTEKADGRYSETTGGSWGYIERFKSGNKAEVTFYWRTGGWTDRIEKYDVDLSYAERMPDLSVDDFIRVKYYDGDLNGKEGRVVKIENNEQKAEIEFEDGEHHILNIGFLVPTKGASEIPLDEYWAVETQSFKQVVV